MADYKTMYHKTFNALTDADRLIRQASTIIQTVQQECEDIFIEADDTPIILPTDGKELPHED